MNPISTPTPNRSAILVTPLTELIYKVDSSGLFSYPKSDEMVQEYHDTYMTYGTLIAHLIHL